MDVNALAQTAASTLVAAAWKVAGAVILWLVGRWLIGFALRLLRRTLVSQSFDPTLSRYLEKGLGVAA